jgi:hypothetical protein
MREWKYSSMYSQPRQWVEVSGRHVPAALLHGTKRWVDYKAILDAVKRKISCPSQEKNTDS